MVIVCVPSHLCKHTVVSQFLATQIPPPPPLQCCYKNSQLGRNSPAGPAVSGKTELTKDMAWKHCVLATRWHRENPDGKGWEWQHCGGPGGENSSFSLVSGCVLTNSTAFFCAPKFGISDAFISWRYLTLLVTACVYILALFNAIRDGLRLYRDAIMTPKGRRLYLWGG